MSGSSLTETELACASFLDWFETEDAVTGQLRTPRYGAPLHPIVRPLHSRAALWFRYATKLEYVVDKPVLVGGDGVGDAVGRVDPGHAIDTVSPLGTDRRKA